MVGGSHEDGIILNVLTAVDGNAAVTQRVLAKQLGIALGLANTYLKRCVKKGLIKVMQVPANRYAYYLTPMGFSEKSRLTAFYLTQSLQFFRSARIESADLLMKCEKNNWRRVVLFGASDFTEILMLCAGDFPVEIIGIVDDTLDGTSFANQPVRHRIADFPGVQAVIVCALNDPQAAFDIARAQFRPHCVLAPRFLNVSVNIPQDGFAE